MPAQRLAVSPLVRRLPGRPLAPLLQRLIRGAGDPTHRRTAPGVFWRATRNPDGPVLLRIEEGAEAVAYAWGPGAGRALEELPELLGDHDDDSGFRPTHPWLVAARHRHPGLRVGRTNAVWEAFAPAVIEQRVTGREAFGGYRRLVRRFGEPAPGPARDAGSPAYRMMCPPAPQDWGRIPSWEWLRAGVDPGRSRVVSAAAHRAGALERTLGAGDADRRLQSLPGVGPWTSAEVRQRAHGDPDAWSSGDYHVPGMITLALTGEALDNDAAEELLEPYRGHRYRIQQLVEAVGLFPERHGPRRSLPTHLP